MKDDAEALMELIRRRIESRYRRVKFVYQELAKVDAKIRAEGRAPESAVPSLNVSLSAASPVASQAAANPAAGSGKGPKPGAAYGGSFEDLVFGATDFSVYRKIDAEEFSLLFDGGLDDFGEDFYRRAFNTDRETIRKTIFRFYLKVGPFYVCRKTNPLILSIMRSIHTSLEFGPLLGPDDFAGNSGKRIGQRETIIAALNGVVIRHDDGMETRLFTRPETASAAPSPKEAKSLTLWGTFHPMGKAHTILLL